MGHGVKSRDATLLRRNSATDMLSRLGTNDAATRWEGNMTKRTTLSPEQVLSYLCCSTLSIAFDTMVRA